MYFHLNIFAVKKSKFKFFIRLIGKTVATFPLRSAAQIKMTRFGKINTDLAHVSTARCVGYNYVNYMTSYLHNISKLEGEELN